MICPKCLVQMHQVPMVGGGKSTDKVYTTWELKQCPACGRYTREYYSARVVSSDEARRIFKISKEFHKDDIIREEVDE